MQVTLVPAITIIISIIIGNIIIEGVLKSNSDWYQYAFTKTLYQLEGILIFLLVLYFTTKQRRGAP